MRVGVLGIGKTPHKIQHSKSLRDLAGRHSLDLGKVVALGHSAGGHLAVWAAGRRGPPSGVR